MRYVVIGDIMVDETVYGSVDRISPEAPIPVLQRQNITQAIGGAGNVAINLKTICPNDKIDLIGFVSNNCGRLLPDIELGGCEKVIDCEMNTKLRYVDIKTGYHLLRVDNEQRIGCFNKQLAPKRITSILSLSAPDAIILSDYNKGSITEDTAQNVIRKAEDMNIPVFVDTRRQDPSCFSGASFMTPNLKELGIMTTNGDYKEIMNYLRLYGLLVTKGHEGMDLYIRNRAPIHQNATNKNIVDVTGAGDTALAAFTAAMTMKPDQFTQALTITNTLAGEVCMHKGTSKPAHSMADYGY